MASITPHEDGWRVQISVQDQRDSKVLRTKREANAWAAAREHEIRDRMGRPQAEFHTLAEALLKYSEDVSTKKDGTKWEQNRIEAFVRDFPQYSSRPLASADTRSSS